LTHKRLPWRCSGCRQTCPRHWNYRVHIERKHPGLTPVTNTQQDNLGRVRAGRVGWSINSYSNIMRWVLRINSSIESANIEKWLSLFESNEELYMMNPVTMQNDMKYYFSEEPGRVCFQHFIQMANDFDQRNSRFDKPRQPRQVKQPYQTSKHHHMYANAEQQPAQPPDMPVDHFPCDRKFKQIEDNLEERITNIKK